MIKAEKFIACPISTEKIKYAIVKHYLETIRMMETPRIKWPYPTTVDGVTLTRKDVVDVVIDMEKVLKE